MTLNFHVEYKAEKSVASCQFIDHLKFTRENKLRGGKEYSSQLSWEASLQCIGC